MHENSLVRVLILLVPFWKILGCGQLIDKEDDYSMLILIKSIRDLIKLIIISPKF